MNKIYKSIWSWTRSCFVAVSEASNSHANGKKSTTLTKQSRAFHFCKLNKTVLALSLLCALPIISETAFADGWDQTLVNDSSLGTYAGDALVIGQIDRFMTQDANVLTQDNLVYRNVTGTSKGLYVNNGKTLTLVGTKDGIVLADGPVSVFGADTSFNSAKLIIGSPDASSPTKGSLISVYVGMTPDKLHNVPGQGELRFSNGEFNIGNIFNQGMRLDGGVLVERTANVTIENYFPEISSYLLNEGNLLTRLQNS